MRKFRAWFWRSGNFGDEGTIEITLTEEEIAEGTGLIDPIGTALSNKFVDNDLHEQTEWKREETNIEDIEITDYEEIA